MWNDTINSVIPEILKFKEEIAMETILYFYEVQLSDKEYHNVFTLKIQATLNTYYTIQFIVKKYIINSQIEGVCSMNYIPMLRIEYSNNPEDNFLTIASQIYNSYEFILDNVYKDVDEIFNKLINLPCYLLCNECFNLLGGGEDEERYVCYECRENAYSDLNFERGEGQILH
jgi:hypothetical protein